MELLNILASNKIEDCNIIRESCVEESFFNITLEYLIEMKNEMNNGKKKLYKSICESTDYGVITESFSDFFDTVKKIIKKFIDFIKSLVNRFITALHRFVSSDRYLKKHEKDFTDFRSEDEFQFKGYVFTFNPIIPVINAVAEFNKEFVNIDFDEILVNNKTDQQLIDDISNKKNKLQSYLDNEYYDEFRGSVIGSTESIDQSDFQTELFEVFRNGDSSKIEFDVDRGEVNKAVAYFKNYKEIYKSVKRTKKQIEKDYKEIQKQIKKMVYRNKDNDLGMINVDATYDGAISKSYKVSDKVMAQLDSYIKLKANQVENMSIIHGLAFSAKLDAMLECSKQSKTILYIALSKIQKRQGKGDN